METEKARAKADFRAGFGFHVLQVLADFYPHFFVVVGVWTFEEHFERELNLWRMAFFLKTPEILVKKRSGAKNLLLRGDVKSALTLNSCSKRRQKSQ